MTDDVPDRHGDIDLRMPAGYVDPHRLLFDFRPEGSDVLVVELVEDVPSNERGLPDASFPDEADFRFELIGFGHVTFRAAMPSFRPLERLPETPPEADLECQHYRTFCESGTRSDGTNGFTGIRRNLPLLQRGRYSVILDKETDVRFRSPQRSVAHSFGSGEFGRQLFLRPPRFERGEETEGTASEGFPTQGEAVPPRWAERPAIPARAQPVGLNDATSDIAQWRLPTSTASSIAAKTPNEYSEYRPRNGWRRPRFRKQVRPSRPENTSRPRPC